MFNSSSVGVSKVSGLGQSEGARLSWLTPQVIAPAVAVLLILYLIAGPLVVLLISTLKITPNSLPLDPGPIGLANFARVFGDPTTLALLVNSTVFTLGSLALGMTIAIALAWLVERTDLPFRRLAYVLILTPMAIPGMLFAMSWLLLLDPRTGLVNVWTRPFLDLVGMRPLSVYTVPGMFFVEGIRIVPPAFLMIAANFRNIDPSLEEQAKMSGAGSLETIRRISFPLLVPAILSATIYFSLVVISAFEIPGLLGMTSGLHLLSTRVYWAMKADAGLPDYGYASVIALLLLGIGVGLLFLYLRVTRDGFRFATVTGRGFRPRRMELGSWKYPAFAFIAFFVLCSALLPLAVLFWASLLPLFFVPPSLESIHLVTLGAYAAVLQRQDFSRAIVNTLAVIFATASLTMVLVTLTSWVCCRARIKGRWAVNMLTFLPLCMPGVVVALGVAYVYLSAPIGIYGTIWILVVALTTNFIAFGSRTMNSAYLQIHTELEEAARVSGASWIEMARRVTLPLLGPAFINGWVWVANRSLQDVTIPLMLFSPSSVVLSTIIWNTWLTANIAQASALGMMLVAAMLVLTVAVGYRSRATLSQ